MSKVLLFYFQVKASLYHKLYTLTSEKKYCSSIWQYSAVKTIQMKSYQNTCYWCILGKAIFGLDILPTEKVGTKVSKSLEIA